MHLTNTLLVLFALASLLHLTGELLHHVPLQNYTKPLLLPLLAGYFLASVGSLRRSRLYPAIFIGLLFSFLGDTLLLFADTQPSLFILGLLSFLVTHLCYLFAFSRFPNARRGYLVQRPLILFPFLLFLIAYNAFLMPNISNSLRLPVIIYSIAIITMALSTLNLRTLLPPVAFRALFLGALLFVASDSILAFNKFQNDIQIPQVGFLIMLTYLAGQYFIVRGVLQIPNSNLK